MHWWTRGWLAVDQEDLKSVWNTSGLLPDTNFKLVYTASVLDSHSTSKYLPCFLNCSAKVFIHMLLYKSVFMNERGN
jgi:hypothetical protein